MKDRIKVFICVSIDDENRQHVRVDIQEKEPTLSDIALLNYNLERLSQELIDRDWDEDGYEVCEE